MKFRTYATWGLGVAAIPVCPILVIFVIPLAIGIGADLASRFGAAPVVFALWAAGIRAPCAAETSGVFAPATRDAAQKHLKNLWQT